MRMTDIIEKKRDRLPLSENEIKFFVSGVTDGSIPDYQISALLMAILLNGMNREETLLSFPKRCTTRRAWRLMACMLRKRGVFLSSAWPL